MAYRCLTKVWAFTKIPRGESRCHFGRVVAEMLIGVLVFLAVLIAIEASVVAFGADSRDGDDWLNHRTL